jgi:hypothetical protein
MATLFFDSFNNTFNWIGGYSISSSLTSVNDPLRRFGKVGTFAVTTESLDSYSKALYNPSKSFVVSFDYLGLSKNINVAVNLGGVVAISMGEVWLIFQRHMLWL